ncbi:HAMP domain-containing histidine kinase [Candidatus Gracilibacteria bacterium]|nr:HAMP domain-containing histidine kinase [Candidatus Gracilibacteria bacterium]
MDHIQATTYKLSAFYTLIFIGIFFLIGMSFFALKYFSDENIYIQETAVSEFESTGEGQEIDDIFLLLTEAQTKESVEKKQYSLDELKSDMKFLGWFLLATSIIFFLASLKLVVRTIRPVAQNMDDMKHFIDHAGHELKTPLSVIDSSIQLMNAKKDFDPDLLQKSQKEILRTNALIETLRDLSNITEVSKKQKFMIGESIEKIIESYRDDITQKDIEIVRGKNSEDFEIYANISYFEIVFSNILNNAIKYSPKDSRITIRYKNKSLIIQDEGEGIPKDKQEKIFQRFYRMKHHRKQEGFGLGLALVERICSMYAWKISLESELGEGTKVKIGF